MLKSIITIVVIVFVMISVSYLWYRIIKSVLDNEDKYRKKRLDEIKKGARK